MNKKQAKKALRAKKLSENADPVHAAEHSTNDDATELSAEGSVAKAVQAPNDGKVSQQEVMELVDICQQAMIDKDTKRIAYLEDHIAGQRKAYEEIIALQKERIADLEKLNQDMDAAADDFAKTSAALMEERIALHDAVNQILSEQVTSLLNILGEFLPGNGDQEGAGVGKGKESVAPPTARGGDAGLENIEATVARLGLITDGPEVDVRSKEGGVGLGDGGDAVKEAEA